MTWPDNVLEWLRWRLALLHQYTIFFQRQSNCLHVVPAERRHQVLRWSNFCWEDNFVMGKQFRQIFKDTILTTIEKASVLLFGTKSNCNHTWNMLLNWLVFHSINFLHGFDSFRLRKTSSLVTRSGLSNKDFILR